MAMRVAGVEEGEGSKAMAMAIATRMAGEQTATAMMRVMVTKTIETGAEEGNSKGGKSNGDGDGKESSNGKRWRQ